MLKGTNHTLKDNRNFNRLNRDLSLVLETNPGLMIFYEKQIPLYVYGNYKVIDSSLIVQGDWDIKIPIPRKYPYEFPILIETSQKIPRTDDQHISADGVACTELDIIREFIAKKGIMLSDFINNYVFKYFCWQLLSEHKQIDKLESWAHNEKGLKEFFYQILGTTNDVFVLTALELLKSRKMPGRNDFCFCGAQGKYKNCHEKRMAIIDSYGSDIFKYIPLFK